MFNSWDYVKQKLRCVYPVAGALGKIPDLIPELM